jgi:hypothetical protein
VCLVIWGFRSARRILVMARAELSFRWGLACMVSMPSTKLSYVVGSNSRKVSVDGVASDWGSSVPLVSF